MTYDTLFLDNFIGAINDTLLTHSGELNTNWTVNSDVSGLANYKISGDGRLLGVSPAFSQPKLFSSVSHTPIFNVKSTLSLITTSTYSNGFFQIDIGGDIKHGVTSTGTHMLALSAYPLPSTGNMTWNFTVRSVNQGAGPHPLNFNTNVTLPVGENIILIDVTNSTIKVFINGNVFYDGVNDLTMWTHHPIFRLGGFYGPISFGEVKGEYLLPIPPQSLIPEKIDVPSISIYKCIHPCYGVGFPWCRLY